MLFKLSKKIISLLLYLLAFHVTPCFSQNATIDSLKNNLLSQVEDTNKVNTLNKLARELVYAAKYTASLKYALNALSLAEKFEHKQGMVGAYWAVVASYYGLSNYDKYVEYSNKALQHFKNTGNLERVGYYLNNLSVITEMMGDTTETLKLRFEALKVRRQIDDKWGIIQTINSIGLIYSAQGKCDEAMQMHDTALQIWNSLPNKKGFEQMIAYTHQCLGVVYEKMGDQASVMGQMKIAMVDYQKALEKHRQSSDIWKQLKQEDAIAGLNFYMGKVLVKLKNYKSANALLQSALQFYLQSGNNEDMDGIYLSISLIDSARGNYKDAYNNFKKHVFYKEAFANKDLIRKVESNKGKSEFEKKESQLKLLAAEGKLQTILAKEQQQKKNFAYAGIGLILLGGTYGFYRFRKKKSYESKIELTRERLRISRELHDEVGSTLSGISMYSHLTKEQIKNAKTDDVEKSLNIIQQSAGDMVNKLNDIVWFINPDQDTLQKLIQRLEEYAGDMAAIKNMQVNFLLSQQFSKQVLPVESRRNIYLFCKEAINNAVKYSEAAVLHITIKEIDSSLEIAIGDNGKGFDLQHVNRGNGLNNMHKRAQELGARFDVKSTPGEGCLILLKIKLTQRGIV